MSQDERDRKCAANHVLETGLRHLQDRWVAAPAETLDLLHLLHLECWGPNPKAEKGATPARLGHVTNCDRARYRCHHQCVSSAAPAPTLHMHSRSQSRQARHQISFTSRAASGLRLIPCLSLLYPRTPHRPSLRALLFRGRLLRLLFVLCVRA